MKPILIAHDDPATLERLVRALAPLGYPIERAVSGQQAVALAQMLEPELVIAPLPLRGTTGTRLVATLRESRVLFLSCAVLSPELGVRTSFAPANLSDAALRGVVFQLLGYRSFSINCRASRALTP